MLTPPGDKKIKEEYSFENYKCCLEEIASQARDNGLSFFQIKQRQLEIRNKFYNMNLLKIRSKKDFGLISNKEYKDKKGELKNQYGLPDYRKLAIFLATPGPTMAYIIDLLF